MNNGFRPKKHQKCRIVGRCHPRCVNKVVLVTDVDGDFYQCMYYNLEGEERHGGGLLGGLEPMPDNTPIDKF